MSMLDYFGEEMNRTFTSYNWGGALDSNDNPIEGHSATATISGKQCAFWQGSAAQKLVADRFKTAISGVVVCETDEIVPDNAKIVLDNGKEYIAINSDDVMFQGEAQVIAVKNPDNNTAIYG